APTEGNPRDCVGVHQAADVSLADIEVLCRLRDRRECLFAAVDLLLHDSTRVPCGTPESSPSAATKKPPRGESGRLGMNREPTGKESGRNRDSLPSGTLRTGVYAVPPESGEPHRHPAGCLRRTSAST